MGRAKVSDKAGKVRGYDLGLQSVGRGESWKNMEPWSCMTYSCSRVTAEHGQREGPLVGQPGGKL